MRWGSLPESLSGSINAARILRGARTQAEPQVGNVKAGLHWSSFIIRFISIVNYL
ncbi:hypothetical protein JG688_00016285 [Phytophthora aleatoria]|uniref:Uncharacterized protein n=1 Tax=Phytophthora aleatoria TaxID=2496075 RepID=A0A8J5IS60_9STRA|nr:hypothetical protein JG688_00016285 [Phytophthora aleatoria]